jgi:hypothetical protein
MDVHIWVERATKKHLKAVHESTSSSQKSEARKPKKERNELRQGLRGRIVISALLHFSG